MRLTAGSSRVETAANLLGLLLIWISWIQLLPSSFIFDVNLIVEGLGDHLSCTFCFIYVLIISLSLCLITDSVPLTPPFPEEKRNKLRNKINNLPLAFLTTPFAASSQPLYTPVSVRARVFVCARPLVVEECQESQTLPADVSKTNKLSFWNFVGDVVGRGRRRSKLSHWPWVELMSWGLLYFSGSGAQRAQVHWLIAWHLHFHKLLWMFFFC